MYEFPDAPFLLVSFHPSQQNTFTGKLTPDMMREVFAMARGRLEMQQACADEQLPPPSPSGRGPR